VVVLSALVLGITLGVKNLYGTDAQTMAMKIKPLLAILHINIDEKKIGDVAGKFVERISQTDLGSGVSTSRDVGVSDNVLGSGSNNNNENLLFKVVIMSDIHEDVQNLDKAVSLIKSRGIETVFILGDTTNYGDTTALNKVKNVLENSGLDYYVLPGDHDLAQSVNVANFNQVFGQDNQVIQIKDHKFLLFNNSYNFTKIGTSQISWLENNIIGADFVLLSQPLYTKGLTTFFENIYMGSSSIEPGSEDLKSKQEEVRDQGIAILSLIRSENNVKAVFAGEHHKSSKLTDSNRNSLEHYVVGAISNTVNEYPQNIIQTPRFSLLSVFKDRTYQVNDIVLN
jgi:predicted phosphodiesterase